MCREPPRAPAAQGRDAGAGDAGRADAPAGMLGWPGHVSYGVCWAALGSCTAVKKS